MTLFHSWKKIQKFWKSNNQSAEFSKTFRCISWLSYFRMHRVNIFNWNSCVARPKCNSELRLARVRTSGYLNIHAIFQLLSIGSFINKSLSWKEEFWTKIKLYSYSKFMPQKRFRALQLSQFFSYPSTNVYTDGKWSHDLTVQLLHHF